MLPIPVQFPYRLHRSDSHGVPAGSQPMVPSGADRPDDRMARDGSRALPPPYLDLGANASLRVTTDLAQLLGLEGSSVELGKGSGTPVFSLSGSTTATPAPINHNIPPSSYRYLKERLFVLLAEVAQRAIGEGPDDPQPPENSEVAPEWRRLGDMAYALLLTPGREHDSLVLRNAGWALYSFFIDYRTLVGEMRDRRPDLEPVLGPWITGIAHAAIERALEVPLGADGQPQYDPSLYDPIVMPVRQPLQSYIPALELQLDRLLAAQAQQRAEQDRERFMGESRQYFAGLRLPLLPDAPRNNRLLGAASNELESRDQGPLLNGELVFRCPPADLAAHLRMIPAGSLRPPASIWPFGRKTVGLGDPPFQVKYPDRASGTTIEKIRWRNPANEETKTVMVANWQGVHSYSLDEGAHWLPTGGRSSPAFDAMRAENWRAMLARCWHDYRRMTLGDWDEYHLP